MKASSSENYIKETLSFKTKLNFLPPSSTTMAAEKAIAFEIDFKENAVPAPTNVKERFESKPL